MANEEIKEIKEISSILYYEFLCPHCNKFIYVYSGDPNDLTKIDPEIFLCCHCNKKSCLGPKDNVDLDADPEKTFKGIAEK